MNKTKRIGMSDGRMFGPFHIEVTFRLPDGDLVSGEDDWVMFCYSIREVLGDPIMHVMEIRTWEPGAVDHLTPIFVRRGVNPEDVIAMTEERAVEIMKEMAPLIVGELGPAESIHEITVS